MERFTVEEDGLIRDEAIREMLDALKELFPWTDCITTEAQLALVKAQDAVFSQLTPDLFELGLSPSRFNALRFLYVSEGRRLTMGELRAKLGVSTPLVTKVIDSLVREGWVVRVPSQTDRRIVFAQLTEQGASRFEERWPIIHRQTAERWTGLTDDEKLLLIHLLNKFRVGMLAQYARSAVPPGREQPVET